VIHLELFFVYGIRYGMLFIFSHVDRYPVVSALFFEKSPKFGGKIFKKSSLTVQKRFEKSKMAYYKSALICTVFEPIVF